jgi:hypothetical protein
MRREKAPQHTQRSSVMWLVDGVQANGAPWQNNVDSGRSISEQSNG